MAAGDRLTKPLDLSSARWQILGALEEAPLSVAQIARNMGLTRQTVQRLADELEKSQFIQYAPNPDHKKAKLVCLTEKSLKVMKVLEQRQIRWANEVTGGVRADKVEAALGLIKKLRSRSE
ncbi:MAG TPA: MarR family transcriptional regulator [Terriglobales bacterium]|nr:MarR family transcriptional regulator [Terriglobales bacterium]